MAECAAAVAQMGAPSATARTSIDRLFPATLPDGPDARTRPIRPVRSPPPRVAAWSRIDRPPALGVSPDATGRRMRVTEVMCRGGRLVAMGEGRIANTDRGRNVVIRRRAEAGGPIPGVDRARIPARSASKGTPSRIDPVGKSGSAQSAGRPMQFLKLRTRMNIADRCFGLLGHWTDDTTANHSGRLRAHGRSTSRTEPRSQMPGNAACLESADYGSSLLPGSRWSEAAEAFYLFRRATPPPVPQAADTSGDGGREGTTSPSIGRILRSTRWPSHAPLSPDKKRRS